MIVFNLPPNYNGGVQQSLDKRDSIVAAKLRRQVEGHVGINECLPKSDRLHVVNYHLNQLISGHSAARISAHD